MKRLVNTSTSIQEILSSSWSGKWRPAAKIISSTQAFSAIRTISTLKVVSELYFAGFAGGSPNKLDVVSNTIDLG